jgi:hypothetical protein
MIMEQRADGIMITLKDVYDDQRASMREVSGQVAGLAAEVSRFSGRLDSLDARTSSGDASCRDHEARLRSLERWRYAFPVSAGTAVLSAIIAFFSAVHH